LTNRKGRQIDRPVIFDAVARTEEKKKKRREGGGGDGSVDI